MSKRWDRAAGMGEYMKRIIISGATSMIGLALTEAAVSRGCEVYAIAREGSPKLGLLPKSELVTVVNGSLENLAELQNLPKKADVFYHFAWAGTRKQDRADPNIQAANIKYTLDAVAVARACGCAKFIGAGSQAEYGPVDGEIDDNTRFKPATAYGAAKNAAFLLSRKLCERAGICHIWGRIFSVYGTRDREDTMLIYAIDRFLRRERADFSAGTQSWNYLHERDAGEIFCLLGERVEKSAEYRIADETSRPLREYIETIAEVMDARDLCFFAPADCGRSKVYGLKTCDAKLFSDIGFRPRVPFREGIREVIEERTRKTEI